MNFEEALVVELNSVPGLKNKVFPLSAPEGIKTPFIVYVSNEGIQDKTLEGYLNSKEVVCEIHVVHSSYGSLKPLTKQVLTHLKTFYSRVIGDNGPFIENFSCDKPTEVYEREVNLYRSSFDITVNFKEE
jgi:hypothetical protein